jgi:protein involved in polysaccharide export with SLBB domain
MKELKNVALLRLVCCAAAATLLLSAASLARAQGGAEKVPPTQTEPPPVQRMLEPTAPPGSDESPRLGVGDVIDIIVTTGSGKSPQLSAENLQVDEKGRIQIFDGIISAMCLTPGELAANIKTRYLQYKREPLNVVVSVKEYRSQLVAVIGAVKAPGRFELRRSIRLLELLALYASGPDEHSDGRIEVVHTQSAICSGTEQTQPLETALVSASYNWEDTRLGREEANPYVRPGDVISLAEAPQVFVIGNVREPKSIPLRERITLTTALAMAGGTLDATKSDQIRIERQRPGSPTKELLVINLNAIKKRQADDPVLMPGDIVEVPASTGGKILRSLLGAIVPMATQTTVRVIR